MKISEVINKLNEEKIKIVDLAKQLNTSRDTLSRRLKTVGYVYSNTDKTYNFEGDLSEKNNIDEQNILEVINKTDVKKSDKNQRKVTNKTSKNNTTVVEEPEVSLTTEEILFLKKLVQKQSQVLLSVEFSMLPPKATTKKHQMEISEQTYNEFEKFSTKMKDKRYSKNDLIEIALVRLMQEFS